MEKICSFYIRRKHVSMQICKRQICCKLRKKPGNKLRKFNKNLTVINIRITLFVKIILKINFKRNILNEINVCNILQRIITHQNNYKRYQNIAIGIPGCNKYFLSDSSRVNEDSETIQSHGISKCCIIH